MSVSRRSFFSAVAGAIAGAVASRVVAKAPAVKEIAVPTIAGKAPSVVEFARQYDVLTKIDSRKLTATVKVPSCLLEDSPIDVRSQIAEMMAREMAEKFDREIWESATSTRSYTVDVPEWGTKVTLKSIKETMDKLPKYNPRHEIFIDESFWAGAVTVNEARCLDGLNPKPSRYMGYPVHIVPGLKTGLFASEMPSVTVHRTIHGAEGQPIGFCVSTNWPVKNSA